MIPPGESTAELVEQATEITRILRRIPWSAREFTVDSREARRDFGLDTTVQDAICAVGLPHLRERGQPLFDPIDLMNLSLSLRLRTPHRGSMHFWANALTRAVGETRTYEVAYRPLCPQQGHPGLCEYRLREPDDRETVVVRAADDPDPVCVVEVATHNDWPKTPDAVCEVIEELAAIRFMRLPGAIRWDSAFVTANGIGDCVGIARLLTELGRRRGLEVRPRFGLAVAPPFSVQHFWTEFRVEDRWVPYDPGLVDGLVAWGILPPGSLDRSASTGALLAGLSGRRGRAVMHHGLAAAVNFPTRLLAKSP